MRDISGNPATYFGRQLKKERLARGWSLPELSRRTKIDAGHLSKIENAKRPPTEYVAAKCDEAMPERRGWFTEYYTEMRGWSEVPASFKSWPEYEDKASSLHVWCPSVMHGLTQTSDYARALLETYPGVTEEALTARLASRMGRQERVLFRSDDPPSACFLVDELSLYRLVGSAEVMTNQLHHLTELASLAHVIIQVLPAAAHPVNASGFLMADNAVWIEHAASGFVYTDVETVSGTARRFDMLRSESYRASESLALLQEMKDRWATGVSPLTAMRTAVTA
jgi:Domain of unknown function (DUF5753)/Helix-turn-helix domain